MGGFTPRRWTRLTLLSSIAAISALGSSGCGLIVGIEDYKQAGPTLLDLEVSAGELDPPFDPERLTYTLDLPLGQSTMTVTATPENVDATMTVNEEALVAETPSPAITLDLGPGIVDVEVTADGLMSTYHIEVSRGGGLAQSGYLKAINTDAGDELGVAIALFEDTLVIGAPLEDSIEVGTTGLGDDDTASAAGAVYVFRKNGQAWEQEAYLKAPNTDAGDNFGRAVAIHDDLLVVGAPLEASSATNVGGSQTDDSLVGAGAAYVYARTGSAWAFEAYLKASNTNAMDNFGGAVTISGTTIAIGATEEDSGDAGNPADNGAGAAGAVYVYNKVGSTWSFQEYLKADNVGGGDRFGTSVSLDGNLLAIGALGEDATSVTQPADNGIANGGAAYVFERTGVDWSQRAFIKAEAVDAEDHCGTSVAMRAGDLAMGCPDDDSLMSGMGTDPSSDAMANTNAGAVYVFTRDGNSWVFEAYIKSSRAAASAGFGDAIALDDGLGGAVLVVGAPGDGVPGDSNASLAGAMFVYTRAGDTWSEVAALTAVNAQNLDSGAFPVAVSNGRVAFGASGEDSASTGVDSTPDDAALAAGAAYAFE